MPEATKFVRDAVARMLAAPQFLRSEQWELLASYDGPVVADDPDGRLTDHLEQDDNE